MLTQIRCIDAECGHVWQLDVPPGTGEVTCPCCGKMTPVKIQPESQAPVSEELAPAEEQPEEEAPVEEEEGVAEEPTETVEEAVKEEPEEVPAEPEQAVASAREETYAESEVLDEAHEEAGEVPPEGGLPEKLEEEEEAEEVEELLEGDETEAEEEVLEADDEEVAEPQEVTAKRAERIRGGKRLQIPQLVGMSFALITFVILIMMVKCTYDRLYQKRESEGEAATAEVGSLKEGEGWESEEEIAKKLKPFFDEQERIRSIDTTHVVVAQDGSGDYRRLERALMTVSSGGTVEIRDGGSYEEAGIGAPGRESRSIVEKGQVTIVATGGRFASLVQPSSNEDLEVNATIYVGSGWKFKNIIFLGVGKESNGIRCSGEQLQLEGCQFHRLKHAVSQESAVATVEISNCVFGSNSWGVFLQNSADASVSMKNSVVFDCKGFLKINGPSEEPPAELQSMKLALRNNIFLDVGQMFFAKKLPPKLVFDSDYNAFCRTDRMLPKNNVLGRVCRDRRKSGRTDRHSVVQNPRVQTDFRLADDSPCKGMASDGGDLGVRWESLWEEKPSQDDAMREGYETRRE